MRWRSFCAEILELRRTGSASAAVVTLGALLADVPHTRPVPVTSTASDDGLLERLGLEPSRYEGPTGIVGVLQDAARPGRAAGAVAVGRGAALRRPAAVARRPRSRCCAGSRTCSTSRVPLGELPEEARAWERGVDELAAEDGEIAEYVRQLEEAQGHHRAAGGQRRRDRPGVRALPAPPRRQPRPARGCSSRPRRPSRASSARWRRLPGSDRGVRRPPARPSCSVGPPVDRGQRAGRVEVVGQRGRATAARRRGSRRGPSSPGQGQPPALQPGARPARSSASVHSQSLR